MHLVSHGTDGQVKLGNTWLNLDNVGAYAGQLVGWRDALAADADLLFYGCDLASNEEGKILVDSLSTLTGADVAASVDDTGHAIFGADWDLEYTIGHIETGVAFSAELQENWGHLMNVTVDATSTGTSTGGDFSISHTTSGTDRLMLVGVSINNPGANSVNGITYNGDALTRKGWQQDPGGDARVEIWYLVNPDVGTYNVDIDIVGTSGGNTAGVMTYTGVDQTTPLGGFASGAGWGSSGLANVNSAADELVFAVASVQGPTDYDLVPGAGQTERWDLHGGGDINGGGSTEAGAASVVMDWTWGSTNYFAVAGVSIKASPTTNDAPTLADTVVTLTPVLEDSPAPSGAVGTLISDLADLNPSAGGQDNVTDADSGAVTGIAITAADTTNGTWHYSINGGTNWNALGAVSTSNALLLAADADTRIYFEPNANYNGTIANAITFHAWDQTTGSNGGTADLSTTNSTVLDQFGSISYANNDGTASWTSNWTESDDDAAAATGNIRVDSNELYLDNQDGGGFESITRGFDLTNASAANLTFDFGGYVLFWNRQFRHRYLR